VITNEPSTQQTPLPTEPADLPEEHVDSVIQPVASEPTVVGRRLEWFNLARAFLLWAASIVLLALVPVIITLPYLIYLRSIGPLDITVLTTDKILAFLSVVAIPPAHLLTLWLIWRVITQKGKYPFWKAVGFEWPEYPRPAVVTLTCVGLSVALLLFGGLVTQIWGGSKTQLDLLVESSTAARLATAFVAVFTAPLVEELVYRGVLYSALERTVGKIIGVAVVALLFAGVHVFQYQNNIAVIAVITLLSITLTLVRAYTGKVLPSFIIHLVFNGIQSIVIALWPLTGWGSE